MISNRTMSDETSAPKPVAVPTISDEVLMLEFQSGSRAAFEELFARYRRPLFNFFRRRLNHASDTRADDLTQDTFLAVLRATERYEPRAPVRTYLYGIAFNLLASERRRQFRDAPAASSAPEQTTNSDATSVLWIRQALAKLELSEREILMLREYEQLSYAEIAELLELPINTVRSRLFRARMALKDLLESKNLDLPADARSSATISEANARTAPVSAALELKPEPIRRDPRPELRSATEDEGLR
jgi:RNA polymerase sigma-70 factor (ECF subfamily)